MTNRVDENKYLRQAAQGDQAAVEFLLSRYKALVKQKAALFFVPGADKEDIVQEGMLGLYHAVRTFRADKNVPFTAYASTCILTRITDAIRTANRKKHLPLNQSLSFQQLTGPREHDQSELKEILAQKTEADPEQQLVEKEQIAELALFLQADLSATELQCLLLYLQGYSYRQIAFNLNLSVKTVDNALSRARRKINQYRANV